jgi:hypothetical protein
VVSVSTSNVPKWAKKLHVEIVVGRAATKISDLVDQPYFLAELGLASSESPSSSAFAASDIRPHRGLVEQ